MRSASWRPTGRGSAEPAAFPSRAHSLRACVAHGGVRPGRRHLRFVRCPARFRAVRRRRVGRPAPGRGSDPRVPDSPRQPARRGCVRLRRRRSRERGARYRAAAGFGSREHPRARRPRSPRGPGYGRHAAGGDRPRAGQGHPQPLGHRGRRTHPACHHRTGEFVKRQEGLILWERSVSGSGFRCGVGCRDDGGGGTP